MSAAFHPKLPGFLFSARVGPPLVGVLSAKGLGLTQALGGRGTGGSVTFSI